MFSVMLRACLVRGLSAIRNFPGPTLTTQERTERVLSSGITAAPPTEWLEGLMPQAERKTARPDPQARSTPRISPDLDLGIPPKRPVRPYCQLLRRESKTAAVQPLVENKVTTTGATLATYAPAAP